MAFLCRTITKAIIERARIGQTGDIISDVDFWVKWLAEYSLSPAAIWPHKALAGPKRATALRRAGIFPLWVVCVPKVALVRMELNFDS
jgi:hypothetical protein